MPLAVMEKLGLGITRPYKDLYSFDSKRVQCLGMIKYLVVRMVQIPRKFVIMDVVIPDVPPTHGMLLTLSTPFNAFVSNPLTCKN